MDKLYQSIGCHNKFSYVYNIHPPHIWCNLTLDGTAKDKLAIAP